MQTRINVHANSHGESWASIQEAVKTANGLQTQFEFRLCEEDKALSAKRKVLDFKKLNKKAALLPSKLTGLFFCEGSFDSAILVREVLPDRIYVACDVAQGLKAPPFRLYLLYQLASAAITFSSGISQQTNDQMMHDPPVGCLWDWWRKIGERSAAMVAARICPACQQALRAHGNVSGESIVGCQQILDYIRRSMMGESPEVANRIFIAYGRSDDWMRLKNLLEEWGLQVEHFNREPVAGVLIAERWQQMLNRARFAFAVMTPDDVFADGKKQARQNVVHEIGLCHARIGLHNTAILIAKGTETFSNVAGVNYIPFEQGKLERQSNAIRNLLEKRGIL